MLETSFTSGNQSPTKYALVGNVRTKSREGKLFPSECGFHPERKCTCGECGEDETKCDGEPFHSKHPLACPFHALAYDIECTTRALNRTVDWWQNMEKTRLFLSLIRLHHPVTSATILHAG